MVPLEQWGSVRDDIERILKQSGWQAVPGGDPTGDRTVLFGVPPDALTADILSEVQSCLSERHPLWRCVFVAHGASIAVYPSAIRVGDAPADDWIGALPAMLSQMRRNQWLIDGPRVMAIERVEAIVKRVQVGDHRCWIVACDSAHHRNLVPGYDVMFPPAYGIWMVVNSPDAYEVVSRVQEGGVTLCETLPLVDVLDREDTRHHTYWLLNWFVEKPTTEIIVVRQSDRCEVWQGMIAALCGADPVAID
ncbi:MAG: hypothetical protein ACK5Q5_17235 [Planctomycetaceae bacterium]